MENTIFLAFTYITEALIVYRYAQSIYKPRKNNIISFCLVLCSYALLIIPYKYVINNDMVNAFLIMTINILLLYTVFESSFKSALFHGIVLCILLYISEFISLCLIALALHNSWQSVVANHFEIGTILSRIIFFLFSNILSKLSLKENRSKGWGRWSLLSLLPISSIFIILAFRILIDDFTISKYQNIICILSISFLLIMNIFVYWIYEKAEKSNQKLIELELENQKNDIDMQYLELLEKKNETMNIMAHDYKNNVLTIANMTDSKEIKDYINNMIGGITKFNQIAKTKNRLLDVILSKYIDICNDKTIKFETDIMTDNLSFMNNYDISCLFNNILDNAVEAATASAGKFISLEITNSLNAYHKIITVNSCDTAPHTEYGKLLTTKKNKDTHGFGTKSINRIVKKYDGEMQWEYNEDQKQFKLVILLPQN